MGSVSAVTANSADEILNVAGSTAAGITIDDDYESLPFQVDPALAVYETDEVSEELNFELTREVEAWAQSLRDTSQASVQVGVVDSVPESGFDDTSFEIPEIEIPELPFEFDPDGEGDIVIELGRVENAVNLLEAGVDDVTFEVRRVVERTAIIDARPFLDQPAIGSVYIFDLSSRSNVGVTRIRD
ncbi:MAG: hypothetical protein R3183_13345 [Oleiphilaceae bacterium]|nr:hypothetical protein [Oleiphilaceae bacterium]